MKFRLLDLFSGVGGFSLGLERSGYFETVQFCEIDPFCRRVLAKHWPEVPCHDDIRTIDIRGIPAGVNAICGGFPCQDASIANVFGTGTNGSRTGLFTQMVRAAGDLGVEYLVMENVTELFNRGFERVLGSLAEIGFDAEWDCFSARDFGFDHDRERLFIVAYPSGARHEGSESYRGILVAARKALAEHVYETTVSRGSMVGSEPLLRNADGLSLAMERRRLSMMGNAVIPSIVCAIGKAIGEYEDALDEAAK